MLLLIICSYIVSLDYNIEFMMMGNLMIKISKFAYIYID